MRCWRYAVLGSLLLPVAKVRAQGRAGGLAGTWVLDTAASRMAPSFGWPADTIRIIATGTGWYRVQVGDRAAGRMRSQLFSEWPLDSVRTDAHGYVVSGVFTVEGDALVGPRAWGEWTNARQTGGTGPPGSVSEAPAPRLIVRATVSDRGARLTLTTSAALPSCAYSDRKDLIGCAGGAASEASGSHNVLVWHRISLRSSASERRGSTSWTT